MNNIFDVQVKLKKSIGKNHSSLSDRMLANFLLKNPKINKIPTGNVTTMYLFPALASVLVVPLLFIGLTSSALFWYCFLR
jgi:hypothetical protein